MIKVEPAEKYKCCAVCYRKSQVYNIVFRYDGTNSGTKITLCEDCIKTLAKELGGNVPLRIKARWTDQTTLKPFGDDTVQCTQCGFYTDKDANYRYCPNCGSEMEEKNG